VIGQVVAFIILFFLSAFFSSTETALFSLSKIRIIRLRKKHPIAGKMISDMMEKPTRTLVTILLGNTLINVATSALATSIAIRVFGDAGLGIAIGVITLLLLILGEITPKVIAIENAERFAIIEIYPLHYFAIIAYPFIIVLENLTEKMLKNFKPKKEKIVTEDELRTLIKIGQHDGVLDEEEKEMITNVLEFSDTVVKDIMTPRVDMKSLNTSMSSTEMTVTAIQAKHSKMPLIGEDIDRVEGVVHTKPLLLGLPASEYVKKPLLVPEVIGISRMLRTFQKERRKMAVVVDEFGGTAGLVTLEDVLEEIFGEIRDEYEKPEEAFKVINPSTVRMSGALLIDEANDELGAEIPEGDYDTVAGFIMHKLGRLPTKGDTVKFKARKLRVELVRKKRIVSVLLNDKTRPWKNLMPQPRRKVRKTSGGKI